MRWTATSTPWSAAIVISVHYHARSAEDIAGRYDGSSIWAPADSRRDQRQESQSYLRHRRRAARRHPGVRRRDAGRVRLCRHTRRSSSATPSSTASACSSWLEKGMTRRDVADALRQLLDEDIELVLLTHGGPVSDRPREQLERARARVNRLEIERKRPPGDRRRVHDRRRRLPEDDEAVEDLLEIVHRARCA